MRLTSAVVACVVGGLSLQARATTPDWIRESLRRSTDVSAPAEVLLDETRVRIDRAGHQRAEFRQVARILTPAGLDWSWRLLPHTPTVRISRFRAWHLPPDGPMERVRKQEAIETTLPDTADFSDTRYLALALPDVQVGSIVAFEYTATTDTPFPEHVWTFQSTVPVAAARLHLQLADGWELVPEWSGFPEQTPKSRGSGRWRWSLRNVPPVPLEPLMPPLRDVAGRLLLRFRPSTPTPTEGDWASVARRYWQDLRGRAAASPALLELARELAGGSTEPAPEALARYVQEAVQYLAVELGPGRLVPRQAETVQRTGFGDCKDQVTLLRSLLEGEGIPSYPILVGSGDHGEVVEGHPSLLQFNHMIVAWRAPESTPPTAAEVVDPELGRLVLFDPSDPHTPVGELPHVLEGRQGLLVSPTEGRLIRLPRAPAGANRLESSADIALAPDGSARVSVQQRAFGKEAARLRAQWGPLDRRQRRGRLQHLVARSLPGADLVSFEVEAMEASVGAPGVRFVVDVPSALAPLDGLGALLPFAVFDEDLPRLPLRRRHHPVVLDFPRIRSWQVNVDLPEGTGDVQLPTVWRVDSPLGRFDSTARRHGDRLEFRRELVLERSRVEPALYDGLRALLRAAAQSSSVPTLVELRDAPRTGLARW